MLREGTGTMFAPVIEVIEGFAGLDGCFEGDWSNAACIGVVDLLVRTSETSGGAAELLGKCEWCQLSSMQTQVSKRV